jgi:hypothetical protein
MNAELQTEMNEPILDRYDAENAAALCGFAAAAYGGGEPTWCSRPNASDTSASIFQAGGDVVVAFRGTRSLANFVTDVRARRVAFTAAPRERADVRTNIFGGGALTLNLPSNKQPPLPSPLLHKCVEEREMERAWPRFMGSMRECFRGILSQEGEGTAGGRVGWPDVGAAGAGAGCPGGMEAHEGFLAALDSIYWEVRGALAGLRGAKGGRIWLTGHSLGGALAKLFALRAALEKRRPDGVYTFGEPRVGNGAWRDCYDALLKGRTFRVVDGEDLVTRIPWLLWAYRHCGTEVFYPSCGLLEIAPARREPRPTNYRIDPPWWSKGFSDVFGAWREWSREGRLALLADHHIGRYLELYGAGPKWTTWTTGTTWTAEGTEGTRGTNQSRRKAELQTD